MDFGYNKITSDIASNNSEDSAISSAEQELGIADSSGKSLVTHNEQGVPLDPIAAKNEADLSRYVGESAKAQEATQNQENPKQKQDAAFQKALKEVQPGTDILKGALSGVGKAVQNTYNAGVELADLIENKIGKTNLIDASKDTTTWADDNLPAPETTAGKMTQGIAQFMTLFIPGSGIVKGVTGAAQIGMAGSMTAGFAADALAFKGNEGRITDALKDIPIVGDLAIPYLVTKKDDTELEGRLKNGVEGLGLGLLTEGLVKGLQFLKGSKETSVALKAAQDAESGIKAETKTSAKETIDPNLKTKVEATPKEIVDKGAQKVIDEKNAKAFEARKRGVIPDSELDKVSQQSGVSLEELFNRKAGSTFNAEEMNVLNRHHAAAQNDLEKIAKELNGNDSPEMMMKFQESLQAFSAIDTLKSAGSSENARALRLAQRQTSQVAADPEMLKEYLSMYGETDIKQMAYMISNMPSSNLKKVVEKSYKRRLSEAGAEVFRNNLLSNPTTHVKNFASNAGFYGLNVLERQAAPLFGKGSAREVSQVELKKAFSERAKLVSKDTKNMSYDEVIKHEAELKKINGKIQAASESGVEFGEGTQMVIGSFEGFMDGIRALKKTGNIDGKTFGEMVDEASKGSHGSKFTEGGYKRKFSSENIGGGKAIDILGGIQGLPGKGLAWADDFWKFVNYRAETRAQAYRLGKKQGLVGEEFSKFVTDFQANPPDFVTSKARETARVNTFQEELGPLANSFNNFLNKVDDAVDMHVTGFLVPFRQAPVNIATQGFERTPLAVMGKKYKDAIAKGGSAAQIEKAKMALGTTAMGTAAYMAMSGHLTGGGPTDYKMRKTLEQSGWRPYSIKLETEYGTKYVPINKLEPMGGPLQLAADAVEIFGELGTDDPRYGDIFAKGALATYNLVTPDMLTDNLGDIIDALSDPKAAVKFIEKRATKTIPLIGPANTVRNAVDNISRDANGYDAVGTWSPFETLLNEIRNQVPGLSKDLPSKKNIFGEEMPVGTGFGAVLSPFSKIGDNSKDKVAQELVRLGYDSNFKKDSLPEGEKHLVLDMPAKDLQIANGQVNMDSKQYSKYVELSAGIGLENSPYPDMTLKEALGSIIDSNYEILGKYKSDQNKRTIIKSTVTAYRKAAKIQMLKEFPDLEGRLNKSRASYYNVRSAVDDSEGDQ